MILSKTEIDKLKESPWYTYQVQFLINDKLCSQKVRGKKSFTWELEKCVRFTIVGNEGESLFELDGELFVSCLVICQSKRRPSDKLSLVSTT